MNLADVLFLDIYRSVRGGWNSGIIWRARYMRSLLPHTTLPDETKVWFSSHLDKMIEAYGQEHFDGRTWARDSKYDYEHLMQSSWFNGSFYEVHSQQYTDLMERYPAFDWDDADDELTRENVTAFLGFPITVEGSVWRDNRNLKDTWTTEKWRDAIAQQEITLSFYESLELPFALRLARDDANTSSCTAQGRSLAEALRSLADWVEMNTKEGEL